MSEGRKYGRQKGVERGEKRKEGNWNSVQIFENQKKEKTRQSMTNKTRKKWQLRIENEEWRMKIWEDIMLDWVQISHTHPHPIRYFATEIFDILLQFVTSVFESKNNKKNDASYIFRCRILDIQVQKMLDDPLWNIFMNTSSGVSGAIQCTWKNYIPEFLLNTLIM